MSECKFDKYGCKNDDCWEHYPVISRKTVIAEMKYAEESESCECEKRCEKCGKLTPLN